VRAVSGAQADSPAVSEPSSPLASPNPSGVAKKMPVTPHKVGQLDADARQLTKLLALLLPSAGKGEKALGELAKLIPYRSKAQVASYFIPPDVGIHGLNKKGAKNALLHYLIKHHIIEKLEGLNADDKLSTLSEIYNAINFDPDSKNTLWSDSSLKPGLETVSEDRAAAKTNKGAMKTQKGKRNRKKTKKRRNRKKTKKRKNPTYKKGGMPPDMQRERMNKYGKIDIRSKKAILKATARRKKSKKIKTTKRN